MTQRIPDVQHLPYHQDMDYIKSVGTVAPNGDGSIISDAIKLGQIPESVYLFVRHSRDTSNYSVADSFLSIERINVLFNNETLLPVAPLAFFTRQPLPIPKNIR